MAELSHGTQAEYENRGDRRHPVRGYRLQAGCEMHRRTRQRVQLRQLRSRTTERMSFRSCSAAAPSLSRIGHWGSVMRFFGGILLLLDLAPSSWAHESRPAYLEIHDTGPSHFDLLWQTPLLSGQPLPVLLQLPDGVRNLTAPRARDLSESRLERRLIEAPDGLAAQHSDLKELQGTLTEMCWFGCSFKARTRPHWSIRRNRGSRSPSH